MTTWLILLGLYLGLGAILVTRTFSKMPRIDSEPWWILVVAWVICTVFWLPASLYWGVLEWAVWRNKLHRRSLLNSFDHMRVWGEKTFGDVLPRRIVARANEEMIELIDLLDIENVWTPKAVEEAADVVIILTRAPGLAEAIERKMAINKARKWNLRGDGTGYHIPTPS